MTSRIHSDLQRTFRQFLKDNGLPMTSHAPIEHKGDDESFLTEFSRLVDGNSWDEGVGLHVRPEVPESAVVYAISVPCPVEIYEAPYSLTLYTVVGRHNGEPIIIATDADTMDIVTFGLDQGLLRAV